MKHIFIVVDLFVNPAGRRRVPARSRSSRGRPTAPPTGTFSLLSGRPARFYLCCSRMASCRFVAPLPPRNFLRGLRKYSASSRDSQNVSRNEPAPTRRHLSVFSSVNPLSLLNVPIHTKLPFCWSSIISPTRISKNLRYRVLHFSKKSLLCQFSIKN